MVDSRKLTGHPWHVEFLKKDSKSKKRHNHRCIHFFKNSSKQGWCNFGHIKCIGSSHCKYYREKTKKNNDFICEQNKIQLEFSQKFYDVKVFNDSVYNEIAESLKKSSVKVSVDFNIDVKNIEIEDYSYSLPCIKGINGNNFYMISKNSYYDFI